MSPRKILHSRASAARGGFSLIELMIVIVIISILIAFLLPAIGNVRARLRIAQVRVEMDGFVSGITQFASEYGQEPPSRITLWEAPAGWVSDATSRSLVRQLWPQINLSLARDLNGDGDTTDTFILTGDECLLFFLGGPDTITDTAVATDMPVADGFSKNPLDPFAAGGSRVGPFWEFDPDRMIDYEPNVGGTADGAHSYTDLFPSTEAPYLYLSSYGGRGYRPALDADFNQDGSIMQSDNELASEYLQSTTVSWKDNSYQIISAGDDGQFGIGGGWSEEDGVADKVTMKDDRDNVTNFAGGSLD